MLEMVKAEGEAGPDKSDYNRIYSSRMGISTIVNCYRKVIF